MRGFVVLGLVFLHTKPRNWLGERLQIFVLRGT